MFPGIHSDCIPLGRVRKINCGTTSILCLNAKDCRFIYVPMWSRWNLDQKNFVKILKWKKSSWSSSKVGILAWKFYISFRKLIVILLFYKFSTFLFLIFNKNPWSRKCSQLRLSFKAFPFLIIKIFVFYQCSCSIAFLSKLKTNFFSWKIFHL